MNTVDFSKGLVPAIILDDQNGEVLMLAYMNQESYQKTLETGYTWFFSRSRNELWNKGETSGHTQKVKQIWTDCDNDTLLIRVIQTGPACHTGKKSCFFNLIKEDF
ncbi:TPA: phosphoribosyl-AMP cyclohydrolase [Listeria innocua]|nr:phosphoribosyl-AMP cyclohydrolase [Listeria innocua]HBM3668877.1 phosphoribosyl-AMP cyclohydrolase [Listeria innocua]HBM3730790.1 phosphoribosyl-AMP cyclohydrolase [Listeria innocua]HBM3790886.1 phosphoribosyl-AMP cyclohydrolase [Listeria innocua]HBM3927304.1 phosphoribosyl-AMP cyclohydrolase [Listeria innocua]